MQNGKKTASELLDEIASRIKKQQTTSGNGYYSAPTDTSKEYYDSLFSARENARVNKYSEPIDTTETGGKKIFLMTPESFKSANDLRMNRLAKLREQYSEGENSQAQQMSFLDTATKLPFARQVVTPMLEEANQDDNVHPAVKAVSTIAHGLLSSAMTPYTEGTELINKSLENVNYIDPLTKNKVNLGQEITGGINKVMNLPFEAVKTAAKGYGKIFDMAGIKLPEIVNKETDQKLSDLAAEIGTLYLLGKGHSALKDYVNKKVNIPELKEFQNGKENTATNKIPIEQRESVIGGTKEQTEIGTSQRGSENITQEKTPPPLKWIEKGNQNVVGPQNGKGIKLTLPNGEDKIFVMGEGSHKEPMAMAYRYIADDLMKKGLDQTNAEVFAEDFISQAAVNDKMDIGDVVNGKFKSTWDKQKTGETTYVSGTVEGETTPSPSNIRGTMNVSEATKEGIKNQFDNQETIDNLFDLKQSKIEPTEERVSNFIDDAINGDNASPKKMDLWKVESDEAKNLKDKTGLDLEGYTHKLENYGLRHGFKGHSDPVIELSRGQIPITSDDLKKIPDIIKNADDVKNMGKNKSGVNVIRYEKRYNGSTYYLEEIRTNNKELVPKTMYKKKSGSSKTTPPLSNGEVMPEPNPGTSETLPLQMETNESGIEKQSTKSARVSSLKPFEGEGETKQRGASKSFAENLTRDLQSQLDLPEYQVRKNAPQIQAVTEIAQNNPEQLIRMYLGQEKIPDNILPSILHRAVGQMAKEGKFTPEINKRLANSDFISKQGTTAGQFSQGFGVKDPLNPIDAISEVKKFREETFLKRTNREDINKVRERVQAPLKKEITKNNLKFRDWNDFVQSLVCK